MPCDVSAFEIEPTQRDMHSNNDDMHSDDKKDSAYEARSSPS